MRGRRFSTDVRESVSCATKLQLDYGLIEAITGVSKRQIQRIASEEEHGVAAQARGCGKQTRLRILKHEHLEASNYSILTATHFNDIVLPFFSF